MFYIGTRDILESILNRLIYQLSVVDSTMVGIYCAFVIGIARIF